MQHNSHFLTTNLTQNICFHYLTNVYIIISSHHKILDPATLRLIMNGSHDTQLSEKRPIIRRHTLSREPESPKALVFDPSKPEVVTEEDVNERNSEYFNSRT